MPILKPKFITFNCYGTFINFEMAPVRARFMPTGCGARR